MLYIFIFEISGLVFLYFYTRGSDPGLDEITLKKNHISAALVPVAVIIVDKLAEGRFESYKGKLTAKLTQLYGGRNIKYRLKLHLVQKTMHLIAAVPALTLLGGLMDKPDISYFIFASVILLTVFFAPDRELDERIKKRSFYIQYEFPDFLNKLVLLINAGMTVPRAWEKIVSDRHNMTPLYEELNATYIEIKNGKPEISAYEDFARRCRVKEVTKFITLVIQNLKKGSREMVPLLRLQASECWEMRKNLARRLGEEASTKLVLPLMIMFVGILVIVVLPAVLQLKYL